MKTITNCYVYIISNGEVYYSHNESTVTLDISKAAFFRMEGSAKSRKKQVTKRICNGLYCLETDEYIKNAEIIDYKVTTYEIEEPLKDFIPQVAKWKKKIESIMFITILLPQYTQSLWQEMKLIVEHYFSYTVIVLLKIGTHMAKLQNLHWS